MSSSLQRISPAILGRRERPACRLTLVRSASPEDVLVLELVMVSWQVPYLQKQGSGLRWNRHWSGYHYQTDSNLQIIHLKLWGNDFGQAAAIAFDALLKDVSLSYFQMLLSVERGRGSPYITAFLQGLLEHSPS
jgi:hypothetical protein